MWSLMTSSVEQHGQCLICPVSPVDLFGFIHPPDRHCNLIAYLHPKLRKLVCRYDFTFKSVKNDSESEYLSLNADVRPREYKANQAQSRRNGLGTTNELFLMGLLLHRVNHKLSILIPKLSEGVRGEISHYFNITRVVGFVIVERRCIE